MNIAEVVPTENHILCVTSDDGCVGLFDVKPLLDSEAFSPLKEMHEFELIHNGIYFVEWSCGADLSADTIQARWELTTPEIAQQLAQRRPNTERKSGVTI